MIFSSLSEFIIMGGHGIYVWSAYGFFFFSISLITWLTFKQKKKIINKILKEQEKTHE